MKNNCRTWILFLSGILLLVACVPGPSSQEENETESLSAREPAATPPIEILATPAFEIVAAPSLTKIEMLDEQNGWGQAEGMVLRTEDGGESWFDATPEDAFNDPAYARSAFLDEEIGWILLEDLDSPTVGTIYRTTDGGASWLWRNTPFGRSYIGFLDAENGYALTGLGAGVGSEGVAIWETKNGGGDFDRTFVHQPGLDDSLPYSGIKNGITFRDKLNGWVSGSVPQNGFIWLYRTRDGGFTWAHQGLTMPNGYENAQTSVRAPLFFDELRGLLPIQLLAEKMAMVFYRTDDGGESWTATLPVPTRGKFSVISGDEIVVWDGSASIFFTVDGGETWSFHASEWLPGDILRELDFVSATKGWALTDLGLYRTDDGGKTWEKLGD